MVKLEIGNWKREPSQFPKNIPVVALFSSLF